MCKCRLVTDCRERLRRTWGRGKCEGGELQIRNRMLWLVMGDASGVVYRSWCVRARQSGREAQDRLCSGSVAVSLFLSSAQDAPWTPTNCQLVSC